MYVNCTSISSLHCSPSRPSSVIITTGSSYIIMHVQLCEDMRPSAPAEVYNLLRSRKTRPNQGHTYIHTYIRTLDNAHNSQAQRLNLRRWQWLGGKRTLDINDEQTDGVSSRDAEPLKLHSGSGSGSASLISR